MTERLSHLYREALRQQGLQPDLDAETLQALADGRLCGEPLQAAIDRLALQPDAPALLAFVRDADHEARLLALQLRRADAVARSWTRPRRARLALAAAAAVAALALLLPLTLDRSELPGQADAVAVSEAPLEVDRDVILAASFEPKSGATESRAAEGNGNSSIFHSRFDG
jgi:hypothetical protein